MFRPSRRDMLQVLARAGGLALLSACGVHPQSRSALQARAEPPPPVDTGARPHYIVRITLDGGFDSVMTVDPKDTATAGEVDPGYRADERRQGSRRLYGPLIGGLLRHDDDLCLAHGVRYNTVAHETGEAILRAGHQRYSASARPFGDLVGELLPGGAPIPHLHIQTGRPEPFVSGPDMLQLPGNPAGRELPLTGGLSIDPATVAMLVNTPEHLFESPPWFEELRAVQVDEARRLPGAKSEEVAAYQHTVEQAGHLHQLLATAARSTSLRGSPLGPGLQLAFHAMRGNFARFITVRSPRVWLDTHTNNAPLQRARTLPTFDDIAGFVDMLKHARNAFGTLFEQTTIVIASEIGRFPKLNLAQGKDHWPENSWILLGQGIRGGTTLGATDRTFRGIPVSYRTGRPNEDDRRPLDVDALFATILRVAGGAPRTHGYERDSVIDYIVAR